MPRLYASTSVVLACNRPARTPMPHAGVSTSGAVLCERSSYAQALQSGMRRPRERFCPTHLDSVRRNNLLGAHGGGTSRSLGFAPVAALPPKRPCGCNGLRSLLPCGWRGLRPLRFAHVAALPPKRPRCRAILCLLQTPGHDVTSSLKFWASVPLAFRQSTAACPWTALFALLEYVNRGLARAFRHS